MGAGVFGKRGLRERSQASRQPACSRHSPHTHLPLRMLLLQRVGKGRELSETRIDAAWLDEAQLDALAHRHFLACKQRRMSEQRRDWPAERLRACDVALCSP